MDVRDNTEGMLSPYRVLDLTDEKGLLCGKLLGDLGADVIKVERPGGDPARNIGPFYHDEVNPEKSLLWWAFNTSKRGITLDIENADGQETFKKLVSTAGFVIESFSPGYMDRLGLGYKALEKLNPGIIMVSISPFGQSGPYKDYKAPDIVAWAMGGKMYLWGDADRPPIRISYHSQAYLHAGGEAAVGAMLALRHRQATGEGQHVDVSIQECVVRCTERLTANWDTLGVKQQRDEQLRPNISVRRMWPCKDGHMIWLYWSGPYAKRWNMPLIDCMDEGSTAKEFLKQFDWDTFDWASATQEVVDCIEKPAANFFMAHTKSELLHRVAKYRAMLYPVCTTKDILESVQLAARGFWLEVEHSELGISITYPGAFASALEPSPKIFRRAPIIGEHNDEVYAEELDLDVKKPSQSWSTQGEPANTSQWPRYEMKRPLEGVRVIDFGAAWAGPLTAKTLCDHGAEVVKIESRNRPDVHRTLGPFKDNVPGLDRSGQFNQDNVGKLSVTINIAHPKGIDIVKRLVARADVVIDNFAGGAMQRIGIGYDQLRKVNPAIIMLSSCMQGQTGPYGMHPGLGLHLSALSGFNQIAGWPDRQPAELGTYTDFIAPHFNVLAILAALDYRSRTGKGQYIDMSQYENGIHFMAPLILDYVVNGQVANRMGNRSTDNAPHGAYRCCGEDSWCALAVLTDEEWQSFKRVVGGSVWTTDAKFANVQLRKENEDELDKLIEEWTIKYSAEEIMSMMQAAGVAAGVLQTGEDLLEHDPQLKHRHFFWELDHPETGKYRAPGPPFILSKCPYELRRAPLIGEHNEYVLKGLLGMPDEEIAELIITGVIE